MNLDYIAILDPEVKRLGLTHEQLTELAYVFVCGDPAFHDWIASLTQDDCDESLGKNKILDELFADPAPPLSEIDLFVQNLVTATDEAIKTFGAYSFNDKGPGEVMDIDGPADQLRKLDGAEAGARLEALAKRGEDYKTVADAILGQLDGQPEGWWEHCCSACPTVEY